MLAAPAQSRRCTSMHNRRSPIPTVSKPYQNLYSLRPGNLPLSEKQTPQVIDKSKSRKNAREPKEASWELHTQEVTGSSPVAPTITINSLQAAKQRESSVKRANLGRQLGGVKPTVGRPNRGCRKTLATSSTCGDSSPGTAPQSRRWQFFPGWMACAICRRPWRHFRSIEKRQECWILVYCKALVGGRSRCHAR